jgi:hypothetical protein
MMRLILSIMSLIPYANTATMTQYKQNNALGLYITMESVWLKEVLTRNLSQFAML